MLRPLFVAVVVLSVTEAAAAPAAREPAVDVAELVSGAALTFPESAEPVVLPTRAAVFDLDAEMQSFVAPLKALRDSEQKLVMLLKAMDARGLFSMDYAETTRTTSRTFHERQGNCLSFTMLFIALARETGLTASYQSVEVPPTWINDGAVVIAHHVNAVVRTGYNEETVVDFNIRDFEGQQTRVRVSDEYALGLFYNNLGAEALLRQDSGEAFEFFRAATEVYPEMTGPWVNLGVLYAHAGLHEYAEAAYLRALEVDDSEPSALVNLALAYANLGETELAAAYQQRVQKYRERNPYYHYSLAAHAVEEQRWEDALLSLRKAVRLKYDEPEFYTLRARALEALGRGRDAANSLASAQEYAEAEKRRQSERVVFDALALR